YKGVKHVLLESLPAGSTGPFVVGTIAAAAVGLVAIDLLLGYVRRHDYTPFVIYRLLLAAAIVIVIVSGPRSATFYRPSSAPSNRPDTATLRVSGLASPAFIPATGRNIETQQKDARARGPARNGRNRRRGCIRGIGDGHHRRSVGEHAVDRVRPRVHPLA